MSLSHDPGPVPSDRPNELERAERRLTDRLMHLQPFDSLWLLKRLADKHPADVTRYLDHIDDAKDRSSRRQ